METTNNSAANSPALAQALSTAAADDPVTIPQAKAQLNAWRKSCILSPSVPILERIRDSLQTEKALFAYEVVYKVVGEAATEAMKGSHALLPREFPNVVSEVSRDYVANILRFADQIGWSRKNWTYGVSEVSRSRRAKLLTRLIEACKKTAERQAAVAQRITYRATLDFNATQKIAKFEVVDETRATITFRGVAGDLVTERKDANTHAHFDTYAEAKEFLMAHASTRVAEARRALELANSYMGNVKGMRDRSWNSLPIALPETKKEDKPETSEASNA